MGSVISDPIFWLVVVVIFVALISIDKAVRKNKKKGKKKWF